MRRALFVVSIPVLAVIFAMIARPFSMGMKLGQRAEDYALALSVGNAEEARAMMTPGTAEGLSVDFLNMLEGTAVPDEFRYDGSDSRGLRMAGTLGEAGSRGGQADSTRGQLSREAR